jgi:thiamine biosynthesis lipoprotein
MGSACRILVSGDDGILTKSELVDRLRCRLEELEAAWSRFRPTSEISVMNEGAGLPVLIGADTMRLVVHAEAAWRLTHGWFDPLMLAELIDLGYDRDHHDLPAATPWQPGVSLFEADAVPGQRISRMPELEIDQPVGMVSIPAGTTFDPGGVGKGLAADMLVEESQGHGVEGILVDLGGDVRMSGTWYGSELWPAIVGHPEDRSRDLAELRLAGGGLATSSRLQRRWQGESGPVHHLLDPSTAAPAESDVVVVTVHAGAAWFAEAIAKAVLVAGREAGAALIEESQTAGLIVDINGKVDVVGPLDVRSLTP